MARPTKFTKQHLEPLYENLGKGMPLAPACAGAGIGLQTFKDWREQAKAAARKRGRKTARDLALIEFLERIDDAIAAGHHWLYAKWLEETDKKRGEGNWLPYEKMLERRFRDDYRIQQKHEHAGPDGKAIPMRIDIAKLSDVELDQLEKLIAKGKGA